MKDEAKFDAKVGGREIGLSAIGAVIFPIFERNHEPNVEYRKCGEVKRNQFSAGEMCHCPKSGYVRYCILYRIVAYAKNEVKS
jgi:hypothetical protein